MFVGECAAYESLVNRYYLRSSLHEKSPNAEFFLVRIFPHSDWIQRDNPYLSVFSPNAGKCGPEKTPYLDTFHTVDGLKRDIQIDDLVQGKCNGIIK